MEVNGILHDLAALSPGNNSGSIEQERRSGRFREDKNLSLMPGFESWIGQPVA
jgi:hypothetical protein